MGAVMVVVDAVHRAEGHSRQCWIMHFVTLNARNLISEFRKTDGYARDIINLILRVSYPLAILNDYLRDAPYFMRHWKTRGG